jgi:hypothetical protein
LSLANLDNRASARVHLERAAQLSVACDDDLVRTQVLGDLARMDLDDGDAEAALVRAAIAVRLARDLLAPAFLAMALVREAEAATCADQSEVARRALLELLGALRSSAALMWLPDALELTAIWTRHSDPTQARVLAAAASTIRAGRTGTALPVRKLLADLGPDPGDPATAGGAQLAPDEALELALAQFRH